MMPFGVLRMWLLGLLGWAALGAGIYLFYKWSDGISSPETVSTSVPNAKNSPDRPAQHRTVIVQRGRQGGMAYLLGGVVLLLLASGGFTVPFRMLSYATGASPTAPAAARCLQIERPDGSVLQVEHIGPETGPVLLLTHGWTLDRSDWDGVRRTFGDRYHLVLWDLAGLGESKRPQNADHSLEKMAADLEAVLTQATSGPVILVGHSIGGMIQQTFCRLFPHHLGERVRGLVFVHTTYTNPAKTALGSPLLTAIQKPILEPLTYLTIWLAPLMWLSNWQSYWNGSLHLSSRLTSFAGRQTWRQLDHASRLQARASPAVTGRGMLAMTQFDEQATVPCVYIPALIVAGADDRLTKREASAVLAQLLPDAKVVTLEPVGHFGHWEQADEFHAALGKFVESFAVKPQSVQKSVTVSSAAITKS